MNNLHCMLIGKVAIVTGGARGIGGDISKLMAENGAHIIIADVLDEVGAEFAKSIGGVFIHCDVSKESDVESAVQLALLSKGKLDIIICNAGIIDNGRSITNLEMKNVASLINVNLNGVIHGIKHAARAMISLNNKGSIVCCTSSAAIMGGLASHAYTLTKGAILGLSRSTACELGVHGIRVNCVSPHGIPSEMLVTAYRDHLGKPNMTIEQVSDMISKEGSLLQGRCGTFEDIAHAVLFLVSEEAGFITGHNLVIDGGYTCASGQLRFVYEK
ncbi:short-chain dehydrogenase reductase ATA1-like [Rutidosis leptorrhynchoides]|uniref:short-chain dehydrogenase reductase ATA1-like n=1 Tax=Rutidosis leptorrhynchoides TaxID=125765 RepID=UPI003A98F3EF